MVINFILTVLKIYMSYKHHIPKFCADCMVFLHCLSPKSISVAAHHSIQLI